MCRFAYTTYEKTLNELTTCVLGLPLAKNWWIPDQDIDLRCHHYGFYTTLSPSQLVCTRVCQTVLSRPSPSTAFWQSTKLKVPGFDLLFIHYAKKMPNNRWKAKTNSQTPAGWYLTHGCAYTCLGLWEVHEFGFGIRGGQLRCQKSIKHSYSSLKKKKKKKNDKRLLSRQPTFKSESCLRGRYNLMTWSKAEETTSKRWCHISCQTASGGQEMSTFLSDQKFLVYRPGINIGLTSCQGDMRQRQPLPQR